jgi:hypothetical protein
MSRSAVRRVSASIAALGAVVATVFAAAGPAAAAAADPVTGGTTTLSVSLDVELSLAKAGIVETPLPSASIGYDSTNRAVTESFPVTGGNARVTTFTGELDHSGSLLVVNLCTGRSVTLGSVVFDLFNDQITAVPRGSSSAVVLFDTAGDVTATVDGTTHTFTASDVQVDPAGASYLDSALGTSYFVAGQHAGSFSSVWTYTGD